MLQHTKRTEYTTEESVLLQPFQHRDKYGKRGQRAVLTVVPGHFSNTLHRVCSIDKRNKSPGLAKPQAQNNRERNETSSYGTLHEQRKQPLPSSLSFPGAATGVLR